MGAKKILIVDDDQDIRMAMRIMLWASQYDTIFAQDAASAITLVEKEHPTLIILDLGLPDNDGFTVMEYLKSEAAFASIPIIVVTAQEPRDEKERALNAGAIAFFQKPVNGDLLLNAIYKALEPSHLDISNAS